MSDEDKFYVFYTWAYGYNHIRKVFDTEKDLLEFIKETKEDERAYRNLIVIRGEEVEFEPHTVVETWRIKESDEA